jgi:hypothetical protein
MQFQWNFTGLICSSSHCAYCTGFPVEWFLAELWPFDKKVFFSVCCQIYKSLSGLLLIIYLCNFIQTLQEWSVLSLVVHCLSLCMSVRLSQNLSPLLLINYWGNFILTLQEFMSPAYSNHFSVCHKTCPNMKLVIMRRHMWSLITLVSVKYIQMFIVIYKL